MSVPARDAAIVTAEREVLSNAASMGPGPFLKLGLQYFHFTGPRSKLFHVICVAAKETPSGIPERSRIVELLATAEDSGLEEGAASALLMELLHGTSGSVAVNRSWYVGAIREAWAERESLRITTAMLGAAEIGDMTGLDELREKLATVRRKAAGENNTLPVFGFDEIMAHETDPRDSIWPGGVLTSGDPAALIGAPGVGKSRMALQAAIATILGNPFLGWETNAQGEPWLFLQTENSIDRLKHDLQAMTWSLTAGERDMVRKCLRILNVRELVMGGICLVDGHPDRDRITATLDALNPRVVVIDPLRDAGRGDLNKDLEMTEACAGISAAVKQGNPRRVPLVIHHGRTGACEASKVFGDDAGSFGRNSKVLNGWLRSQINVAAAGIDHEGVIICGCGKNSNGPKWQPFAARLDERTMSYTRLLEDEFDLSEWEGAMGSGKPSPSKKISPEDVAAIVQGAGGEIVGGEKSTDGLVQRVRREFNVSFDAAAGAVRAALGATIQYVSRDGGKKGGVPRTTYILKNDSVARLPAQSSKQCRNQGDGALRDCAADPEGAAHQAMVPPTPAMRKTA